MGSHGLLIRATHCADLEGEEDQQSVTPPIETVGLTKIDPQVLTTAL
jgi:hypothetical protein